MNYYIWLIVAVGCFVGEMFTMEFSLTCLGIGMGAGALVSWLGVGLWGQVIAFGLVAAAAWLGIRPIALRHLYRKSKHVPTPAEEVLGKTAVVETINSMMLQSTRGVLRLFPNWLSRPASFTRLRAKGAYLVTAAYDGKQVTHCQIQATHADTCRLRNPWPGRSVRVTDQRNGRDVTTTEAHGVISFAAQAGHSYQIQQH